MIDLSGKVALVPGASGAIGGAVASLLSECGASVLLGYGGNAAGASALADRLTSTGRRALASQIDATNERAVRRWVDIGLQHFGRVDILASCVGIGGHFQPFKDESPSAWKGTLDTELMSFIYLAHAVVNLMVEQRSGRILALSSDSAKVGEGTAAVSSAARGGVNAFTKALAREVGVYGVTVNAICPGPTDTPTVRALAASEGLGAKIISATTRAIPLKRLGQPPEVAAVFAFLASDEASYITGQAISVSGGLTMC